MSAIPMGLDVNTILLVILFPLALKNMSDISYMKGEISKMNGKKETTK